MKNKLSDLNDHLFLQLERLGDETLKGEDLEQELDRARGITVISQQIIQNADLVLKAEKMKREGLIDKEVTGRLLNHGG
jgi:hypothetical protein